MNEIGKIKECYAELAKHSVEESIGTQPVICEILDFHKGEVYVFFNDKDNIQKGILGKVKEDIYAGYTLAVFSSKDDTSEKKGDFWTNRGSDGGALITAWNYNYFIRLA